ncbi:MAG: hypothetical protein GY757_55240 [bacterium]|nr:hypothetical protein [bacterium]
MKKLYVIIICVLLLSIFVISAGNNGHITTETDVLNLIRSHPAERIVAITTVNPDNSPHISTVGIFVQDELIKFKASDKIAIARNLQRTKKAVITLYKVPEGPLPLKQHTGARIWVKLLADKNRDDALKEGKSIKSFYSMEIVKIEPLHETVETSKTENETDSETEKENEKGDDEKGNVKGIKKGE